MDFMFRSLILVPVFLTGCSAVDKTIDYFTTSGDASEIETAAAKNIAAAAQSDNPESTAKRNLVAGVTNKIADETAAMIDRNLGNSRTSISVTGLDKGEGSAEIKNVTGLTMGSNDQRQTFFQGGLKRDDDRTNVNLGIGQRYLSDNRSGFFNCWPIALIAPRAGLLRISRITTVMVRITVSMAIMPRTGSDISGGKANIVMG